MKKTILIMMLWGVFSSPVKSQYQEAIQLALNIEKLLQLKKILENMYTGYKILTEGYNKVKNIAEGNYKIHELFMDGLMVVNPKVKGYKRVFDIIEYQKKILKEYKSAYKRFSSSEEFSLEELNYLSKVYGNLSKSSIENVNGLIMIITASKLRMNDGERLQRIDALFEQVQDQLTFLRQFNNQTAILALQRYREQNDINVLKRLHGVEK